MTTSTLSPAIQPGVLLSVDFPSMGKENVRFVVESVDRDENRIDIKNQDSQTGNTYSITISGLFEDEHVMYILGQAKGIMRRIGRCTVKVVV